MCGFLSVLAVFNMTGVNAQDTAPFFECRGCDESQMRQAALDEPGLGVRILFDLDAARLLKFRVFEDPRCAVEEEPEQPENPVDGCLTQGIRQLEILPVDAALSPPFAAMLNLHRNAPPFVESGKVAMPISLVNEQLEAPQAPFDPYRIAFDRFSAGSYPPFEAAAASVISNEKLMRQLNPPIASLIFDVWAPVRLARVADGSSSANIPLAPRFALDDFIVDFVSEERQAMVSMRFTSADMGILQARDETGVLLPAREDVEAERFERRFSGAGALESANRLGNFIKSSADIEFVEFDETCESAYLMTCTGGQDGHACRIECSP
ncbi:hypothetical protein [Dokdonella sp.]|uniref:hypothetical protein n=1 Tax=Dokdonella sp. TaxID=2291710 RepID=UPI003C3578F7